MSLSNRICELHKNVNVTHICNYTDCKLQRWCCVECIKQGVHKHNFQDQTYVIDLEQMRINKLNVISKLYKNQQELEGLRESKQQLVSLIKEYQQLIEQQLEKIQKDKAILQKFTSDLTKENFIQLDDKRIDEIININYNEFLQEKKIMQQIQNINENVNKVHNLIKKYQENLHYAKDYFDLSQRKYSIRQIEQSAKTYSSSIISNNEQYLAYSDDNNKLKIYDIMKAKIIKEIYVKNVICLSYFKFDSSQLYVGCENGFVYGFDVLNNFKTIYKQFLFDSQVRYINIIQNKYLLTFSNDGIIKKVDLKSKKLLFILVELHSYLLAMDYNMIDDMIIGAYFKQSIKLWNCRDKQIVIDKQQSHPSEIFQIQFINHYQNVLSLDYRNNLYKWRINLQEKDLIKVQEFRDPNQIQDFYQINQNQNLLLICKDRIKILDQSGKTINTLILQDQKFSADPTRIESKQIDSARYIILRSKNKINLAIAQD